MDYSLLSGSPLFNGINPDNIELIISAVPYRTRKYQTGMTIVQSGDQVSSLIIVLAGSVKGVMAE